MELKNSNLLIQISKKGVAYGAGGMCYAGIVGVPPFSSPRHTPGMKPAEQGFIGVRQDEYQIGARRDAPWGHYLLG